MTLELHAIIASQKQGHRIITLLLVIHYTVKPAYKDNPKDQETVVLVHRWSLYAGSITGEVYHWGPVNCGLYKQVPGGLYIQVVFRAGWPIYYIVRCCSVSERKVPKNQP